MLNVMTGRLTHAGSRLGSAHCEKMKVAAATGSSRPRLRDDGRMAPGLPSRRHCAIVAQNSSPSVCYRALAILSILASPPATTPQRPVVDDVVPVDVGVGHALSYARSRVRFTP